MAKRKSAEEKDAERRFAIRAQLLQNTFATINRIIRFGTIILCIRYVYLSIEALAGRATFSHIMIALLGNVTISRWAAWIFGAGGVVYGVRQNKLRKDTVARLAPRARKLEEQLDKRRSSSKLTERGETNPEDKL